MGPRLRLLTILITGEGARQQQQQQQQAHKPIKLALQLGKGGLPPHLQPGAAPSSGNATPATSTGGAPGFLIPNLT